MCPSPVGSELCILLRDCMLIMCRVCAGSELVNCYVRIICCHHAYSLLEVSAEVGCAREASPTMAACVALASNIGPPGECRAWIASLTNAHELAEPDSFHCALVLPAPRSAASDAPDRESVAANSNRLQPAAPRSVFVAQAAAGSALSCLLLLSLFDLDSTIVNASTP